MDKNLKNLSTAKLISRIEAGNLPVFGDYTPIEKGWSAKIAASPYDIAEGLFPPKDMDEKEWGALSEEEKAAQGVKREWITVTTTRRKLSLRTLLSGGSFEPRTPETFFESQLCISLPGKWISCTSVTEVERNGIKQNHYTWEVSETQPKKA